MDVCLLSVFSCSSMCKNNKLVSFFGDELSVSVSF